MSFNLKYILIFYWYNFNIFSWYIYPLYNLEIKYKPIFTIKMFYDIACPKNMLINTYMNFAEMGRKCRH